MIHHEPLERRQLLSATLADNGVLRVVGDEGVDNVIAVTVSGEQFNVLVNGEASAFDVAEVRRVMVHGRDGNDSIDIDLAGLGDGPRVSASGWRGNDMITGGHFIHGGWGDDVLTGNDARNVIFGDIGDDTLLGLGGNDWLRGAGGDDLIEGGAGDDWLVGGRGNDRMLGGDGHDLLLGQAGDDTLEGGAGHDFLLGNRGTDVLRGGDGDDRLWGGRGADDLDGGGQDGDVLRDREDPRAGELSRIVD
jgi:Ca2+-binding RTX toxin-like protein